MPMIEAEALNTQTIADTFDEAGHQVRVDEDGDIYISGDDIEFPVWIGIAKENLIRIFTYMIVKEGVSKADAVDFSNSLNESIIMPSFWISQFDENRYRLWGSHYIPARYGVEKKVLIYTVRRFAGAMRAAQRQDEEDKFLD